MTSRRLDDLEELMLPAAIAVGGLYLLYWTTTRLDNATDKALGLLPDDPNIFGPDGWVDRWTLNPGEIYRAVDRATVSPWEAADMARAQAERARSKVKSKLRWRPW